VDDREEQLPEVVAAGRVQRRGEFGDHSVLSGPPPFKVVLRPANDLSPDGVGLFPFAGLHQGVAAADEGTEVVRRTHSSPGEGGGRVPTRAT
jgi:hypothetical protein